MDIDRKSYRSLKQRSIVCILHKIFLQLIRLKSVELQEEPKKNQRSLDIVARIVVMNALSTTCELCSVRTYPLIETSKVSYSLTMTNSMPSCTWRYREKVVNSPWATQVKVLFYIGSITTTRMSWPNEILQYKLLEKPWRLISGPVGY